MDDRPEGKQAIGGSRQEECEEGTAGVCVCEEEALEDQQAVVVVRQLCQCSELVPCLTEQVLPGGNIIIIIITHLLIIKSNFHLMMPSEHPAAT